MTRINSAINVKCLTDEHLLAEAREIKRLPSYWKKSCISGSITNIPKEFRLGTGHVLFFLDKFKFTLERYKSIYDECIYRGFDVEDFKNNWNDVIGSEFWKDYMPTSIEKKMLIDRISDRIYDSRKQSFHYYRKKISKDDAISLLKCFEI